MLSDNIKILRKKKGYSQETLAEQLHVVRQTISKWEKGISVPDAVMLDRMAELFEVPVSVLLGGGLEVEEEQPSELNEIAQQLAVLNDQLVQQAVRETESDPVCVCWCVCGDLCSDWSGDRTSGVHGITAAG